ncbi:MAG TPA: acetate/propionate family kinase [Candidatus Saccharimonadales bacterium]|nr:acetate/propionate family kinase [Candidatus Saccharimonadales bacterium]
MTIARNILTVNAGSSSIKLTVFANNALDQSLSRVLDISINNIGQPVATLEIATPLTSPQGKRVNVPNHTAASRLVMEHVTRFIPTQTIIAVGHRIVHGGAKYADPTLITNISDADWKLLMELDPEHTAPARQLVTQFVENYPSIPHVACFDTAFFHDLPRIAKIVPIPQKYYTAGVRRYGFHGLSYASLLETFREKAGSAAVNGRVILAHLGSGASLAATLHGKPVETTMGFTPTSGIVMSTRSGDIDPTVFNFLHRQYDMDMHAFNHMVRFESGLLGVSGLTGDMHALLNKEAENKKAASAVELFVRDVKKSIGALSTTLGGIDSLIFSGGIGEQSAVIRARICRDLGYLGIEVDPIANDEHAFLISTKDARVGVHVIPTNEASVIALQTNTLLNTNADKE